MTNQSTTTYSIETVALRRVFKQSQFASHGKGDLAALDDVSLQVRKGELFGLLGPNGAGKTTMIRILCTLLSPSAGRALVEGKDVVKEVSQVRRMINMVSGGETCGYGILNARENLRLFTELYGIPWKIAKPRVEYMLKVVGLEGRDRVRVNKLSTGMRQRLNFARGFTTDPQVLFLDEPTVGLDVHSAIQVRSFIKSWLAEHTDRTILLTTHYMAEADELCDRIAIIDAGKIVACDTPEALKRVVQKEIALDLKLAGVAPIPDNCRTLPGVAQVACEPDAQSDTTRVHLILDNPEAGSVFLRAISEQGRRLLDLKSIQPSLEDVFIKLTGRSLAEKELEVTVGNGEETNV